MTHSSDADTPVVLVHGIRVSGASLHRIADAVTDRPAIHPDLPGHGARRGERFTMAAAVDTIVGEIERAGRPAIVCGMSMGGYVAMAVAGRHPDLVAGVMPMCATTQPGRTFALPFQMFGAATAFLPKEAAVLSRILTRATVGRRVSDDMEVGGLALAAIADVVADVRGFDALGELARYPGPIEFVNGGRDPFRAHERRFLAVSENAHLTVLPGASHLFPLIQPVRTGRLISEFAATCDALPRPAA